MLANKILTVLKNLLLFLGITCLVLALAGFIVLKANWKFYYNEEEFLLPSTMPTSVTPTKIKPTQVSIQTNVKSINNDQLANIAFDPVDSVEKKYISKIIQKSVDSWNGDSTKPIGIASDDFNNKEFDEILNWYTLNKTNLTIPDDLKSSYFTPASIAEIKTTINNAYVEFIKYITVKQVNSMYINELQNNTIILNETNIVFNSINNINAGESYTDYNTDSKGNIINNDYSKLKIYIFINDIYRVSDQIVQSGILGGLSTTNREADLTKYKQARDIATRLIMYKQMTFGLQKAFDTVNTPTKYKKEKDNYTKASKSLSTLNSSHNLSWGGPVYNQINNRIISQNLQANYISLDSLDIIYDMSDIQRQLLGDYLYDRYGKSKDSLISSIKSFSSKFSEYPVENLKSKVLSEFISKLDNKNEYKTPLIQVNNTFGKLPKYVADISILDDNEVVSLFEYLK
jgi:hypothetical protein